MTTPKVTETIRNGNRSVHGPSPDSSLPRPRLPTTPPVSKRPPPPRNPSCTARLSTASQLKPASTI
jgi:hypothetical protein